MFMNKQPFRLAKLQELDSNKQTSVALSETVPVRQTMPLIRNVVCLSFACLVIGSTGCSLIVMANRMVFGDTKVTCAFKGQTNVDLAKDEKTVIVVCSTHDSIREENPALEQEIVQGVTRRLKRQKITMISPGKVSRWIDDQGGYWESVAELADNFEVDYIIHIDIEKFSYMEENSTDLFRGNALAKVKAYKVPETDDDEDEEADSIHKRPLQVFYHEYRSTYPELSPISSQRMSTKVFRKKYLDQTCTGLSKLFYDYLISDRV